MEDRRAPRKLRVDWKLYSLFETIPLRDIGIVGSATSTAYQEPQSKQMEKIIMSGGGAVEIQSEKFRERGTALTEDEITRIRDLAKATGVRVTVHGPAGIPVISFPEDQLKTEMLNAIRAAVLVAVPPEKLRDKNYLPKLIEESEKMSVNIHLQTETIPYKALEAVGRAGLEKEGVGQSYILTRVDEYEVEKGKEPIRELVPLSDFFLPLNILERFSPKLAEEIKEEFVKLKRDWEEGRITDVNEYIAKKKALEEKVDKYVRYTLRISPEINLIESIKNLERLKKELGKGLEMLWKDIEKYFDALGRDRKEAEQILAKIIDKMSQDPRLTGLTRDIFDALVQYKNYVDRLRTLGKKIPEEEKEKAKKEFEAEVNEAFMKLYDAMKEELPKEILKLHKDIMIKLGKKMIDKYGIYPIPEVMSAKEFIPEKAAERLANILAEFMAEHGFIPRFLIENEPAPAPGADPEILIETVKRLRKKFVNEVMRRKERLKRKFGFSDEEIKNLAEKMAERIGITFDTAHHWMWLAHGKTKEEVIEDMKKLLDSGYVKHIHAVDTPPDIAHHHLMPGQGIVDWKLIKDVIEQKKKEGAIPEDLLVILEPFESLSLLKAYHPYAPSYIIPGAAYGAPILGDYLFGTYGYIESAYPLEDYMYFGEGEGYFFAHEFKREEKRGGQYG